MPAPITLLNKGNLIPQMGESQEELDKLVPLNYIMGWIGDKLREKTARTMSDRVIVLRARTGSGKSSSIPTNIYLEHFKKYKANVICTEPKILTTVDIPRDISYIDKYKKPNHNGLTIELFRNMGFQTQTNTNKPKEKGILFCTTGILLQFLKTMSDDKFCKKYRFVIIDEAHERSLDVDLILLMMKRLILRNLSKNPPFLILMSATINVEQYCAYFNTKTVFDVNGQSKPIETIYSDIDVSDIYVRSCEIISKLDAYEKEHPSKDVSIGVRDVIIFMPSQSWIAKMITALNELNKTLERKILPVSLLSDDIKNSTNSYEMIHHDYKKLKVEIDGKEVPAYRRIIVSTNVAETGLTLEYLRYCIDPAYQFTSEFNPRYGISILMTKPTTSSMTLQRKGRVGRKFAGIFYPLLTEHTFDSMIVNNTPSVAVEDMTSHILALLCKESISSMDKLPVYDMITPPSDDSINYSLEKLFTLGAIDEHGTITEMGRMMNLFRKLPVETCKMILSGIIYGVSVKELSCLAILLETNKNEIIIDKKKSGVNPYTIGMLLDEVYQISPTFNRAECDVSAFNQLKAKLLVGCEMLEMLLIYQRFTSRATELSAVQLMEWCESKGLNYIKLCGVTESIDEIYKSLLNDFKINPVKNASDDMDLYQILIRSEDINNTELVDAVIALKRCIYEGYKNNIITWDKKSMSYKTRHGLDVIISSKLTNKLSKQKLGASFKQEQPHVIIYNKLIIQSEMGRYVVKPSLISIMDGYVDVDTEFITS